MARVFTSKKSSAGKQISCRRCQKKINPGDTYKFYFRRLSQRSRGVRYVHCAACPIRPSDLTSSKMGEVLDAQESAREGIEGCRTSGDCSELSSILEDLKGSAESVKEEYESSLENMPEQLRETSDSGQQMQEKIDALESFISELENCDVDSLVEDEPDNPDDVPHEETCEEKDNDECACAHGQAQEEHDRWEEEHGNQVDELCDKALEAVDSLEA